MGVYRVVNRFGTREGECAHQLRSGSCWSENTEKCVRYQPEVVTVHVSGKVQRGYRHSVFAPRLSLNGRWMYCVNCLEDAGKEIEICMRRRR